MKETNKTSNSGTSTWRDVFDVDVFAKEFIRKYKKDFDNLAQN